MSSANALIVDDEPDIRELIRITLERMGLRCTEAESILKAEQALEAQRFDLCLTDMRLPDGSGISLVRTIQSQSECCPVAVITAHGNVELAVEALKAGAFDFVSKPIELNVLRALVQTALRLSDPSAGEAAAGGDIKTRLVGNSEEIRRTRARAAKLARSQAPVYVSGESGVGKELVAQMIHSLGPRANARFVPVNCGAISPELIESELFGHKKGSFTGAHADNPGLFQAAAGGTLFLDEVAELPLSMQVKLLRAIQEKSVRPVGANEEVPVDVRILSATHKNLGQLVEQGEFRQDLFYRVNVIELHVPPLRQRTEDIEILAKHFLSKWSDPQAPALKLSDEALNALERYAFPGNVRELENILERAMTLADGDFIEVFDLALPHASASGPSTMHYGRQSLDDYLAQVEVETIEGALRQADGNKTAAARLLGLKFGALRYRMQKLGLE